MGQNTEGKERLSLALVVDAQKELASAIDSLGGFEVEYLDRYRFFAAVHVNRAADGYITLRVAGKFEASKHLIRTMIETYIWQHALEVDHGLLFRVIYGEFRDDRTWVDSIKDRDVSHVLTQMDQEWDAFKQAYAARYPGQPLLEERLRVQRAAQLAGIESYYGSAYRLYCQFAHASYRASSGSLTDFEDTDNRSVAFCTLYFAGILADNGATAPNFQPLWQRLKQLDQDLVAAS